MGPSFHPQPRPLAMKKKFLNLYMDCLSSFSENLSKIRRDGFIVSGPGKLPCRYIFHIKIRGSIDGWKSIISVCLQQAESLGITSLSFPALGTGKLHFKKPIIFYGKRPGIWCEVFYRKMLDSVFFLYGN